MLEIYAETDLAVCKELWCRLIPSEQLSDLWDVRICFHRHFKRDLFFVVAKEQGQVIGLLPLSYISEKKSYCYFPGEVWKGKTWLEQNRLIAQDQNVFSQMFQWLDKQNIKYNLRYLRKEHIADMDLAVEDEIDYVFHPGSFDFNMDRYYEIFSGKSKKRIRKDIDKFYEKDLVIRKGEIGDFELMVRMNLERFSNDSYFADEKFCQSFRDLSQYLNQKGWLRMTTFMIDDQAAAVDMGCVYNGVYTLLAGGTNPEYLGIAKAINVHHMQEACKQKYIEADFLSGDFSWKTMFHLFPRPLYVIKNYDEV